MTASYSLNLEAVYELAASKQDIAEPLREALKVIEDALDSYGTDRISVSFNGGKDCTVLLHLYAAVLHRRRKAASQTPGVVADEPIKSIYIPMPSSFLELESFICKAETAYNLDLFRVPCEEGQTGKTGMKCSLEMYQQDEPEVEAILIGVRKGDPYSEHLSHRSPTDSDWPRFMRIHPILKWSYRDVWMYLKALDIEYCSLYDEGYTSLGSTYNTYRNPALRVAGSAEDYRPAYELEDGSLERCGRPKAASISQPHPPLNGAALNHTTDRQ